jgi:predicted transcriptional regulator
VQDITVRVEGDAMYWLVFGVMLASGVLGGLVNYYLLDKPSGRPMLWWQCVVVGIAAAFIVPLFLNMIASGLIGEILGSGGKSGDASQLLVLAGFCLVAAITSRQFIDSVAKRALNQALAATVEATEAREAAEELKAAVDATSEPEEPDSTNVVADRVKSIAAEGLSDEEILVMRTMVNSSFSSRSLSGLARQSELKADRVNVALASLMEKGLVAQTTSRKGFLRWYLTTDGRIAVAQI